MSMCEDTDRLGMFLDDHHARRAHRIIGRPRQFLAAGNLLLLLLNLACQVRKRLDRRLLKILVLTCMSYLSVMPAPL